MLLSHQMFNQSKNKLHTNFGAVRTSKERLFSTLNGRLFGTPMSRIFGTYMNSAHSILEYDTLILDFKVITILYQFWDLNFGLKSIYFVIKFKSYKLKLTVYYICTKKSSLWRTKKSSLWRTQKCCAAPKRKILRTFWYVICNTKVPLLVIN
jgi:hypothetical protein